MALRIEEPKPSLVAKFTDDTPDVSPDRVTVKSKFVVPELPSTSDMSLMEIVEHEIGLTRFPVRFPPIAIVSH